MHGSDHKRCLLPIASLIQEIVSIDMESTGEESLLREEILGSLSGKIPNDLKKALKILRAVFS